MVTGRENAHCFFLDTRQSTVSTSQGGLSKLLYRNKLMIKHQLVLTHRTQFHRRQEKRDIINRPTPTHVMCLRKSKEKQFSFLWPQHFDRRCVCNPTVQYVAISVWQTVSVTTNCRFMGKTFFFSPGIATRTERPDRRHTHYVPSFKHAEVPNRLQHADWIHGVQQTDEALHLRTDVLTQQSL